MERKWNPSLGFLIDLLTINQLKQAMIHDKRDEITSEIDELVHDINTILTSSKKKEMINAEFLRDIIILAQYNAHIWYNEKNFRDNGEKDGNDLHLTHGLNHIRNISKGRINRLVNGRIELKKDNVQPFPEWVPSGYE